MGTPARTIKAETYREIAKWLDELARKMELEAMDQVFAPDFCEPVLKANGVYGLAEDLRKRARQIEQGEE